MDMNIDNGVQSLLRFYKDSKDFVAKCRKPDKTGRCMRSMSQVYRPLHQRSFRFAEFRHIATVVGIGFLVVGFIGFFVKLVHIPINNIIVGSG